MNIPEWAAKFSDTILEILGEFSGGETLRELKFYGPGEQNIDDYLFMFFPSLGEVVGGKNDGAVIFEPMSFQIDRLQEAFDECGEISFLGELGKEWWDRRRILFVGTVSGKSTTVYIYNEPLLEQNEIRATITDGSWNPCEQI